MTAVSYADASALVKLTVDESGSSAMERWYVETERVLTSVVGIVETRRAASRRPHDVAHLDRVLGSVEVVALATRVAERAAVVRPPGLRTLDAIHLATALELGADLDAFVTYDDRLAAAARALGLPVVSPA
ncbi:MAG: type II toxin-antitoxin system VapC family toxin [Candidatus Limnocylindrales bacterium]